YIAFAEAWERFSYYGMQALLVLYMVNRLLHPPHVEHIAGFGGFRHLIESFRGPLDVQPLASTIFGLYTGLVYLTPIVGGLIADRWFGRTFSITIGASLMALGHFLMAFDVTFLIALTCLLTGVGCFKGNVASQVGALYPTGDNRRADAFQIYYIFINGGVIAAPLICGTLGETVGWHWGFGAAGVGMLISLAIYLAGLRHLPPDTLPGRAAARRVAAPRLTRDDIPKLAAWGGLLVVVALFWIANGEVLNAYMVWAKAHLQRDVAGFQFPTTWLQSVSAIVGMGMAPVLISLWTAQAKRGREPSALGKMAIGCGLA